MAAPKELYVRTKCINQGGSLMKKIIALLTAICTLFVFAGCGKNETKKDAPKEKTSVSLDLLSNSWVYLFNDDIQ